MSVTSAMPASACATPAPACPPPTTTTRGGDDMEEPEGGAAAATAAGEMEGASLEKRKRERLLVGVERGRERESKKKEARVNLFSLRLFFFTLS